MTKTELFERRDSLLDECRALAAEDLTGEELARFEALEAEIADLDKRIDRSAKYEAARPRLEELGAPQVIKRVETADVDIRTAGPGEIRSAALKLLETEQRSGQVGVSDESAAHIEKMIGGFRRDSDGEVIFDGNVVAKRLLITETPAYRSAFQKALRGSYPAWTPEETAAMNRAAEQSLTNASGGFAVPVLIDPTVILTSGGNSAPVVNIARIENITTNVWKGISSTGATFSNVDENVASAAAQVVLAQPSITAHKVNAFIPFSLEIEGDWPNFAAEMQSLISTGYNDYLAEKTITGTGTIEMWGIFTAIDQTAGSEVTPTTDGALGPEDVLKLWNSLGERSRSRASWLSSVSVESKFRNAGTNNSFFTVDLTAGGVVQLNGRPYYTSEYAAAFSGTTGPSNLAIVGDFNKYVIAQRVGLAIELIPHVVDGNGLPKGQRGYYCWARVGADSVDDASFRLLQNQ